MSLQLIDERGYFWPAETSFPKDHWAPEGGVYGRLTIDAEGSIELELDGTFANPDPRADPDKLNLRTIAGRLKDGARSVVIFEAASHKNTYHSHSFSHENYTELYCALAAGGARQLINDCKNIRVLDSTFGPYEEWLGLNSIRNVGTSRSTSFKYISMKDIDIKLSDRTAKISQRRYQAQLHPETVSSVVVEQATRLRYRFNDKLGISNLVKEHMRFHDLMILLTNSACQLDWPLMRRSPNSNPITLYYVRHFKYNDEIWRHRCWISFESVKDCFADLLQKWISKSEGHGSALYSYFSTRRGLSLFAEHKFVSLMWGLEAFHRACRPSIEDAKLTEKVARIVSLVPAGSDRNWLAKRLRSVGRPSLNQRLNELFLGLPVAADKERIHIFTERCRVNRNGLSHQGRVSFGLDRNTQYLQLEKDCSVLSVFYHCLILMEIGVPRDMIAKIIGAESSRLDVIRRLEWAGLLEEKPRKLRVFNTDPKPRSKSPKMPEQE